MTEPLPSGLSQSERILIARSRAGLSQEQLATKIGVSRRSVISWEQGHSNPQKADFWTALAEATSYPEAWLRSGQM